jgi:hypothetical protein
MKASNANGYRQKKLKDDTRTMQPSLKRFYRGEKELQLEPTGPFVRGLIHIITTYPNTEPPAGMTLEAFPGFRMRWQQDR